jgi:hypothetical protein
MRVLREARELIQAPYQIEGGEENRKKKALKKAVKKAVKKVKKAAKKKK